MNGAESLVRTLCEGGIELCFTNPGTSEIHLVDALSRAPGLRGVPCLFEGVCVGAADGFARMTGRPAATLLHLGPGLSNGLANLHNAKRARVPLLVIVGDHAQFHKRYDAPLTSDIEALAWPFSSWVRTTRSASEVGALGADAIAAARTAPGHIATLIVSADHAWSDGGKVAALPIRSETRPAQSASIQQARIMLTNGEPTAIVLGGRGAHGRGLRLAGRIAEATGASLLAQFSFCRLERGEGRPLVERIFYDTRLAMKQLSQFRQLILVDCPAPVAFFGDADLPSDLTAPGSLCHHLHAPGDNCEDALQELADALSTRGTAATHRTPGRPQLPHGAITLDGLAAVVGALLPPQAIVVDESITSGRGMMSATRGAPPHDWLVNTGGSIGLGVPLAIGASIASPNRDVLCLSGDGSLMYTLQGLWTVVREALPITTVVFSNRSYRILKGAFDQTLSEMPERAAALLDLDRPNLDFVSLAEGMGMPARRVESLEAFARALAAGFESRQPNLIEVPLAG